MADGILKVGTITTSSGSGTITLGQSGETINVSGTAGTGFGKILQVIQANTGTEVTHSTSYADTGLSASITPSSTSNKVLVRIEQACFAGGDGGGAIKLMRDSTSIYTPAVNYAFYGDGSSLDLRNNHCYSFLDSPSSTSAITYKTQGRSYNSTVFKTQNDALKSFITLMEVAG